MVATVEDLFKVLRTNPFIDGIGYFIEITTLRPVDAKGVAKLNERLRRSFSPRAQASLEGGMILGLDFHDHIPTQGDYAREDVEALRDLLIDVERLFGIDHLCIEFQFDMARAREAKLQIDELMQP